MTDQQRNEVIRLDNAGYSQRRIARILGLSRNSVGQTLKAHQQQRRDGVPHPDLPRPPSKRQSQLDPFDELINKLLAEHPDLTSVRLLEELRKEGFTGGYGIVKWLVRQRRPKPRSPWVMRFETGPGLQAQMDYSTYTLTFRSGTKRVHAFSYVLAWSRRQYLCFVERQDLPTTLREHVNAFNYFGGVARTCLYDNMKVAVDRWEDGSPVYNRRLLAFATHYGYRPWACQLYRSQTKGKVERPFHYIETNLLNGRTFSDLDHLNEVARRWLLEVADERVHRETKERPRERFQVEKEHLLALPEQPYDTAEVCYRVVDVEALVSHHTNRYSVPWQRIGQTLAVRITDHIVFVYGPDVTVVAQHQRQPDGACAKVVCKSHRPDDRSLRCAQLKERFTDMGPAAERFFSELVRTNRCGYQQATRVLVLLDVYRQADLVLAIERALRFGALNAGAVERILGAQAEPRPATALDPDGKRRIDELAGPPVQPRTGLDYEAILHAEMEHTETSAMENPTDANQPQDQCSQAEHQHDDQSDDDQSDD